MREQQPSIGTDPTERRYKHYIRYKHDRTTRAPLTGASASNERAFRKAGFSRVTWLQRRRSPVEMHVTLDKVVQHHQNPNWKNVITAYQQGRHLEKVIKGLLR